MFEHEVFEGIDPKPPTSRRWDDMPSKLLLLLVLLFLLSACHGKRKALETLNLSQRYGQQVQYHDTMWQALRLSLDGLTVEWQVDSVGGTLVRAQAERAELGTQRQMHTELHAEVQRRDTLATRQETVAPAPPSGATRSAGYAWLFLLLLLVAAAAYVWLRHWRPRWWG